MPARTRETAGISAIASQKVNLVWFRRDLRFTDQQALEHARKYGLPILAAFIFDETILKPLPRTDARVEFIYQRLTELDRELREQGSGLLIAIGRPEAVFKSWLSEYQVQKVFTTNDYEPTAIARDQKIAELCRRSGVEFHSVKDQVIFEKNEIQKGTGGPYTVFTPYSKKWKSELKLPQVFKTKPLEFFRVKIAPLPKLEEVGFRKTGRPIPVVQIAPQFLKQFQAKRDFPALNATSHLGIHLRFGTVSIREMVRLAAKTSETWLNELIWREFFMQILFHFPHVVSGPFRPAYAKIKWRDQPEEFKRWCQGQTGYPLVDAGMRELNETGFMHNRTRMVTASFLVKHLLLDWRLGEAYFAEKLLDFDLAANNGNWQWVAGSGCDAAPYFRVFNPHIQAKKFDPESLYIRKWVPEVTTSHYTEPIVDHELARKRAVIAYQAALKN